MIRTLTPVLAAAAFAAPLRAQGTLVLTAPEPPAARSTVYLAGTVNNWNPGDPAWRLVRQADGRYSITLPDSVRGTINFKFTLGSWDAAEADSTGRDAPNRSFTVPATGSATYTGAVAGWRDGSPRPRPAPTRRPTVSVVSDSFDIPQLGRTRRVWVYVPPDYQGSRRRYPVLYMHDGQNVFDAATSYSGEWGVDETLDSLKALGDAGAIVVAVDNGATKRLDEYSPWTNARYGGGEGDAYVAFLVNTLKPWVDQHYRTLPDRAHTGVAGSSMGGLISLYAAIKYPDVFGVAGVFSPAFWFAPAVYGYARRAHPLPGTRIYIVTGAMEGDDPAQYARGHQQMVDSLTAAGFTAAMLQAQVRPDGQHAEWFWRREFPAAYRWLFSPVSAPAPSPRRPAR